MSREQRGHDALVAGLGEIRRILSSFSTSRPYPLFASTVVMPSRAMAARWDRHRSVRSSRLAARVLVMVETMPPPAAAISR